MRQIAFNWNHPQVQAPVATPVVFQKITFIPQPVEFVNIPYRKEKRRPRLVAGEYYGVGKKTKQPVLMKKAHTTPISRDEAKTLLGLMCDKFGISGLQISFGRARRGRGGWVRNVPVVSFPTQDNWNKGPRWAGKLQAGLILHELAHVIAKGAKHGPRFVEALDELLVAADGLY